MDRVGKRYGMLVVIKNLENRKCLCRCDCGKEVIRWENNLLSDRKRSCGCSRSNGKDITGQKFGRWTAIKPEKEGKINSWICKCECGNEAVLQRSSLTNKHSLSCGCLQKDRAREGGKKNLIDLTGQKFGKLTVIEHSHIVYSGINCSSWICRCECGNITDVRANSLLHGGTRSCGCLAREIARKRLYNPKISDEERKIRRNRCTTPEYLQWRKLVYEKYNGVCQICGTKEQIDVHHKNSWDLYEDQRYDPNNGVTCCNNCHSGFHVYYGRGNNTELQWLEFINKIKNKEIIIEKYYGKIFYSTKIGDKYGRLTVIDYYGNNNGIWWKCKCDCGNEKITKGMYLRNGAVKSCGCLLKESAIKNSLKRSKRIKELKKERLQSIQTHQI